MKSNPVTDLLNKIKKSLTSKGKCKHSTRRRRTTKAKGKKVTKNQNQNQNQNQKGGVGFSPDVSSCRIGGLPEIVPTSDCPAGAGPGSKHFAKAVYGMKGGAKGKKRVGKGKKRSAKKC
jgi:hypothetical protein